MIEVIEKREVKGVEDCIAILEAALLLWDHNYGYAYKRKVRGEHKMRYTFITGGWSENEYVAGALERNRTFSFICWYKSERGGLSVYEIPTI